MRFSTRWTTRPAVSNPQRESYPIAGRLAFVLCLEAVCIGYRHGREVGLETDVDHTLPASSWQTPGIGVNAPDAG
jgi:hypothetical protein